MTELSTTTTNEITVSKLIEINIPQTNDRGDALASAVQIVDSAYRSMLILNVVDTYRYQALRVRDYLCKQHLTYLKTGEVK